MNWTKTGGRKQVRQKQVGRKMGLPSPMTPDAAPMTPRMGEEEAVSNNFPAWFDDVFISTRPARPSVIPAMCQT